MTFDEKRSAVGFVTSRSGRCRPFGGRSQRSSPTPNSICRQVSIFEIDAQHCRVDDRARGLADEAVGRGRTTGSWPVSSRHQGIFQALIQLSMAAAEPRTARRRIRIGAGGRLCNGVRR